MANTKNSRPERLARLERFALAEIGRLARRGLTLAQLRDRVPDALHDGASAVADLGDRDMEAVVDRSIDAWMARALDELEHAIARGAAADSDRLDAAFAALCARGVLARQGPGWSTREGLTSVLEEAHALRNGGADARGYAFFCDPDIDEAIERDRLLISFGAVSGHREASRAIGAEVAAALGEAGLAVQWDGDRAHEIVVEPFHWSRRPGSLECDDGEPCGPPRAPLPPLDAAGRERMERERAARERERPPETAPAPIRLSCPQVHPLLVERAAAILGLSIEELDAVLDHEALLFEDALARDRAGWARLRSLEADDYDRGPVEGGFAILLALESRGLVGAPWKLEEIAAPPFRWHGLRDLFERARASSARCERVAGFVPPTLTGALRLDVDALYANGRRREYASRIVPGEEPTLSAIPRDPDEDEPWAPSTSLRDVLRAHAPDLDVEGRLERGEPVRSAELGGDPDVIALARVIGLRVEG